MPQIGNSFEYELIEIKSIIDYLTCDVFLHGGRAGDTFAIKIDALFVQRNYYVRV